MRRLLLVLTLGLLSFAPLSAAVDANPPIYGYDRFDVAAMLRYGHPVYAYLARERAAFRAVSFLVVDCDGDSQTGDVDTSTATLLGYATTSSNGVDTVVDSKSNTVTNLTDQGFGRLHWSLPTSVGPNHNALIDPTTGFPAICLIAFAGTHATTPFDGETSLAFGTCTTSCQPGSDTPVEDNEVFLTNLAYDSTDTPTINSSFTRADFIVLNGGGANYGIAIGYKIQTTGGAENPAWATTTTTVASTGMATFKQAAGGAPASFIPGIVNTPIRGGGVAR